MRWTRFFWFCTVVSVCTSLIVSEVDGAARTALASYASAIAMLSGSVLAQRLSRRLTDPVAFIKATGVTRTVATAWFLLFALVFVVALIGALLPNVSAGNTTGFLIGAFGADLAAILGFASLLAIAGPGYTEFREAMARRET